MKLEEAVEKLKLLQEVKLKEVGKCGYTIAIDVILNQLKTKQIVKTPKK